MMHGARPLRSTRRMANFGGQRPGWYKVTNSAGQGPTQVVIYDEIGFWGVSAADFLAELKVIKGDIQLNINSPGGDVWDGIAIYNTLCQAKGNVTVIIDGLAASAASFIAQAASPGCLEIAPHAQMMIHDGFGMVIGNAADLRETADLLDKTSDEIAGIYADRTGKPAGFWRDQMRSETWYSDKEAVAAGLADKIHGQPDAAPQDSWDLSVFAKFAGVQNGAVPVIVDADGNHGPLKGTHSHSHPAYGTQGGDSTHSHEHDHDGDASHSHHRKPAATSDDGGDGDTGNRSATTVVAAADDDDTKPCPTCKGKGKILEGHRKCPDCKGTGKVSAGSDVATGNSANAADDADMHGDHERYDPDGDGDCDACADGDTDHDYVLPDGSPGPKAATNLADLPFWNDGSSEVDNTPWDASKAWHNGATADDPAAFYKGICAGRKTGDPATQDAWALPFKYTPSSPPNAGGVRNALARLSQTQGLTNEAEAKSTLESAMKKVNPDYEPDDRIDTGLLSAAFAIGLKGA